MILQAMAEISSRLHSVGCVVFDKGFLPVLCARQRRQGYQLRGASGVLCSCYEIYGAKYYTYEHNAQHTNHVQRTRSRGGHWICLTEDSTAFCCRSGHQYPEVQLRYQVEMGILLCVGNKQTSLPKKPKQQSKSNGCLESKASRRLLENTTTQADYGDQATTESTQQLGPNVPCVHTYDPKVSQQHSTITEILNR
jgi:hypothetical protein